MSSLKENDEKQKDLVLLLTAINTEIDKVDKSFKLGYSDRKVATYNFLRTMRNEIVKLMVLSLERSPEGPAKIQVTAFMQNDQFKTSAPRDRKMVSAYQKELAQKDKTEQEKELQRNFALMIEKLRQTPEAQQNIAYSSDFKQVLASVKLEQAKNKVTPGEAVLQEIILDLENCLGLHGKVITDSDLVSMERNPFYIMGNQLKAELNKINGGNKYATMLQAYSVLQLAQIQMPLRIVEGEGFKDLGLRKFIVNQMKDLEKKAPYIREEATGENIDALRWESYEMAVNLLITKLEVQQKAIAFNWEGDDEKSRNTAQKASTELGGLVKEMREATKDYFSQPSNKKEKNHAAFQEKMNECITKGIFSEKLRPHLEVVSILKNVALVCATVGLGLIYLKATAEKRGSFWLRETPLQDMQSSLQREAPHHRKRKDF